MPLKPPTPLAIGDIVLMRKAHPCGSNRWVVFRLGIEIGLECLGCKHLVLLPSAKFEKSLKQVEKTEPPTGPKNE
jgi:hypothetical protein